MSKDDNMSSDTEEPHLHPSREKGLKGTSTGGRGSEWCVGGDAPSGYLDGTLLAASMRLDVFS